MFPRFRGDFRGGRKTRQVRYLPDEETEDLNIAELSGEELIELAGRREITPQKPGPYPGSLRGLPRK